MFLFHSKEKQIEKYFFRIKVVKIYRF